MFTVLALIAAAATLCSASPVDLPSLESRQTGQDVRIYRITNKCPSTINLYSAGFLWQQMTQGQTIVHTTNGPAGPFYTDANGGEAGGAKATKAAFWDRVSTSIHPSEPHSSLASHVELLLHRQRPQSLEYSHFGSPRSLRRKSAFHPALRYLMTLV